MTIKLNNVYEARIISHNFRSFAGMDAIEFVCSCEDGELRPLVWLTARSTDRSRAQLAACGFDIDSRDLAELDQNQTLLAGNVVQIKIEEYKQRLQPTIMAESKPSRDRIAAAQERMRGAKQAPAPEVTAEDCAGENENDGQAETGETDLPF